MKSHGETTGFDTSYEEAMKYLEDFSSGKDMHADTKVKKKLRKMNTQSDHSKAFDDSYKRAMRDLQKMVSHERELAEEAEAERKMLERMRKDTVAARLELQKA